VLIASRPLTGRWTGASTSVRRIPGMGVGPQFHARRRPARRGRRGRRGAALHRRDHRAARTRARSQHRRAGASGRPKHAELTVRDTGVSIPHDELAHIFRRFHRLQCSRGRTHEGAGVGLALVHERVRWPSDRCPQRSRVRAGSKTSTPRLDKRSTVRGHSRTCQLRRSWAERMRVRSCSMTAGRTRLWCGASPRRQEWRPTRATPGSPTRPCLQVDACRGTGHTP
jgi:hypothetical protein